MTREIGFKPGTFCFIPIAALTGYNLKEKSGECPWYTGPTLFEALDNVPLPPRDDKDTFCLPVYDRSKSKSSIIAYGKIEKGVIKEGDQVVVMPSEVTGTIVSVYVEEAKIKRGVPGDSVRLALQGFEMQDISCGSVVCSIGHPCHVAQKVVVRMKITQAAPDIVMPGFVSVCHLHTITIPATMTRILEVPGPNHQVHKNPPFAKRGQVALAIIEFETPVCVERFKDNSQLGRFILRYEDFTVAVGVVEKLPKSA